MKNNELKPCPLYGGDEVETYRRGKEAINYLFKELQFCVDTKEPPAGYQHALCETLDCLKILAMKCRHAPTVDLGMVLEALKSANAELAAIHAQYGDREHAMQHSLGLRLTQKATAHLEAAGVK